MAGDTRPHAVCGAVQPQLEPQSGGQFVYTTTSARLQRRRRQSDRGGTIALRYFRPTTRNREPRLHRHRRPAGPWSRAGMALGPQALYVQTADGPTDAGFLSRQQRSGGAARRARDRRQFRSAHWRYLTAMDLDLGSATLRYFHWKGRALVARAPRRVWSICWMPTPWEAERLSMAKHSIPRPLRQRCGAA